MSTLAEIEAAVEQLPLPQQETLFAFLAHRLRHTNGGGEPVQERDAQLLDLATHAEPMGALTNAEIDQAIYGR
jgi:hypothetical protein